MRFSVWLHNSPSWDDIVTTGRHAEALGYEGLWSADHFMPLTGDTGAPVHECWSLLAGLAAAVPRVRIGSMVTGNTYRNPALLAKTAATVDQISGGGRVVLGIGAGWQENEHVAYGYDFPSARDRLDRLDESCRILTGLLRHDRTTVEGTHCRVLDAPLSPKPVGMPLLVGGQGEKRTMRIAARYANEWNYWGTPESIGQKNAVLDSRCDEIDRDPRSLYRSTVALVFLSEDQTWLADKRANPIERPHIVGTAAEMVEHMHAYVASGVQEFILPDFSTTGLSRRMELLEQFMADVIVPFRS